MPSGLFILLPTSCVALKQPISARRPHLPRPHSRSFCHPFLHCPSCPPLIQVARNSKLPWAYITSGTHGCTIIGTFYRDSSKSVNGHPSYVKPAKSGCPSMFMAWNTQYWCITNIKYLGLFSGKGGSFGCVVHGPRPSGFDLPGALAWGGAMRAVQPVMPPAYVVGGSSYSPGTYRGTCPGTYYQDTSAMVNGYPAYVMPARSGCGSFFMAWNAPRGLWCITTTTYLVTRQTAAGVGADGVSKWGGGFDCRIFGPYISMYGHSPSNRFYWPGALDWRLPMGLKVTASSQYTVWSALRLLVSFAAQHLLPHATALGWAPS